MLQDGSSCHLVPGGPRHRSAKNLRWIAARNQFAVPTASGRSCLPHSSSPGVLQQQAHRSAPLPAQGPQARRCSIECKQQKLISLSVAAVGAASLGRSPTGADRSAASLAAAPTSRSRAHLARPIELNPFRLQKRLASGSHSQPPLTSQRCSALVLVRGLLSLACREVLRVRVQPAAARLSCCWPLGWWSKAPCPPYTSLTRQGAAFPASCHRLVKPGRRPARKHADAHHSASDFAGGGNLLVLRRAGMLCEL